MTKTCPSSNIFDHKVSLAPFAFCNNGTSYPFVLNAFSGRCICRTGDKKTITGECIPDTEGKPSVDRGDHGGPNNGPPLSCSTVSDGVNPAGGNNYHKEPIIGGSTPVSVSYNSHDAWLNAQGQRWRHSVESQIFPDNDNMVVFRPDGRALLFTREGDPHNRVTNGRAQGAASTGGAWRGVTNDSLIELMGGGNVRIGWRFYDATNNDIETYNAEGYPLQRNSRDGKTLTYLYSDGKPDGPTGDVYAFGSPTALTLPIPAGKLIRIVDEHGRALRFRYGTHGRIAEMIDPAGKVYTFAFDGWPNLTRITFPDGKFKEYHYEKSSFPNGLTGITDEKGVRYVNFDYDSNGRATMVERAGGVDRYTLEYDFGTNTPDPVCMTPIVGLNVKVTDPLLAKRNYNFKPVGDVYRNTGNDQPAGAGCAAASRYIVRDSAGNVLERSDFNGRKTCYRYAMGRNLELQRVEGLPEIADCARELVTPRAPTAAYPVRTISTEWHPDWRLPTKIAEPNKLTTYVYNGQSLNCAPSDATVSVGDSSLPIAVLCRQTEKITKDNTGAQGLSPTLGGSGGTGTPRSINWTYNRYGQVLTVDGARSVSDITEYTYDSVGNLVTIKNALNHITQIPSYDGNGLPLIIIDPNGTTTTLSYTPRGWLHTVTTTPVGGGAPLTTIYDYEPTGLLSKITQPDGSYLSYTYDNAHRLTTVTDNLRDTVNYTLDAMGNPTQEEVKGTPNSSGVSELSRKIAREYDALNRLKKVTGGLQ